MKSGKNGNGNLVPVKKITELEFNNLVNEDLYQVFLLASPIPQPFGFAIHAWFVLQQNGVLDRWEFGKFRNSPHPNGIGVLHNFFAPLQGMNKYPNRAEPRQPSQLLGIQQGSAHSSAAEIIYFIEKHSPNYPLRNKYRYLGPNSNTYVQWILDHFPETELKLGWRAIGKHYNVAKVQQFQS